VPVHATSKLNSHSLHTDASNLGHQTACPKICGICQAFRTHYRNSTSKVVPLHPFISAFQHTPHWGHTSSDDRLCVIHNPQTRNHFCQIRNGTISVQYCASLMRKLRHSYQSVVISRSLMSLFKAFPQQPFFCTCGN
jgi:hypothetical protein